VPWLRRGTLSSGTRSRDLANSSHHCAEFNHWPFTSKRAVPAAIFWQCAARNLYCAGSFTATFPCLLVQPKRREPTSGSRRCHRFIDARCLWSFYVNDATWEAEDRPLPPPDRQRRQRLLRVRHDRLHDGQHHVTRQSRSKVCELPVPLALPPLDCLCSPAGKVKSGLVW
jgi:hypothetical protein